MNYRDLACLVAAILCAGAAREHVLYDEDKAAQEAIDLIAAVEEKLNLDVKF